MQCTRTRFKKAGPTPYVPMTMPSAQMWTSVSLRGSHRWLCRRSSVLTARPCPCTDDQPGCADPLLARRRGADGHCRHNLCRRPFRPSRPSGSLLHAVVNSNDTGLELSTQKTTNCTTSWLMWHFSLQEAISQLKNDLGADRRELGRSTGWPPRAHVWLVSPRRCRKLYCKTIMLRTVVFQNYVFRIIVQVSNKSVQCLVNLPHLPCAASPGALCTYPLNESWCHSMAYTRQHHKSNTLQVGSGPTIVVSHKFNGSGFYLKQMPYFHQGSKIHSRVSNFSYTSFMPARCCET
jgi:hypothetical protein